ncbi:abortive infection protein, AbiV family [Plantibacter sp. VKM Ac-1784]|uniref:Abortive infection protein, AbiV family n=1 Tax=Plantibacter elymi (nom. nud.) TaxID=199708 RepID=A0ABY1RDX8_9MICO|nr:AbiV family abortive infection protein [Plantibacter sp. VKM Ac-1784]SMQ66975.1 abortive infection protein, AbiV family [Plantibacter sp. VKM Ac-1784]
MRRLTYDQLAGLALAALANARRMYDDAELLRDAGRIPSSFVLLGLAADELGKHLMVASFPAREDSDEQWQAFWKRMGRHEEKLGNSLISAWLFDPDLTDGPPDPGAFHRRRLSATYVDVRDGEVRSPVDTTSAADLANAFALIGRQLTFCEMMLASTDRNRLAATMSTLRETTASLPRGHATAWAMAKSLGIPDADAERFASLVAKQLTRRPSQSQSD